MTAPSDSELIAELRRVSLRAYEFVCGSFPGADERKDIGPLLLEAANRLEQLRQDAARWRYVRDNLAVVIADTGPTTLYYKLRSPTYSGRNFDEVIDKLIAAEREGDQ